LSHIKKNQKPLKPKTKMGKMKANLKYISKIYRI